jgi:Uma2 family endonuclease
MSAQLAISHHLLTVTDYHRMAEVGIFTEDQSVELINGELFNMPPIGSFHADITDRLVNLLYKQITDNVRIRVQNPLYFSELSEPEPDIALVKNNRYHLQHPMPQDVLLLIEVANTSLHYDQTIKLPLYAYHKIPEVWLFNLQEKCLDIYQQPDGDYYRLHLRPKAGINIQPLLVESIHIAWSELLK